MRGEIEIKLNNNKRQREFEDCMREIKIKRVGEIIGKNIGNEEAIKWVGYINKNRTSPLSLKSFFQNSFKCSVFKFGNAVCEMLSNEFVVSLCMFIIYCLE